MEGQQKREIERGLYVETAELDYKEWTVLLHYQRIMKQLCIEGKQGGPYRSQVVINGSELNGGVSISGSECLHSTGVIFGKMPHLLGHANLEVRVGDIQKTTVFEWLRIENEGQIYTI